LPTWSSWEINRGQELASSEVTSQGASSSGMPLQEANSSSRAVEGGGLKLRASKGRQLHMEKTKLSGSARWKLKS
jgi:hypothetical protein